MKIAVLSDIHSNLPALKAVLRDIENLQPDKMICLGDLVGYAPFPNEVVSIIQSLNIPVIMGNYDQGVEMTWMIVVRIEPMKKEDWELFLSNGPKMTTSENKRYLRNLLLAIN